MSAEHIVGLVIKTLCLIMERLQPKQGNPLADFFPYIISILCLHNVSNKLYHVTGEDQLSAQNKRMTDECCLVEHYVRLWNSYGL